MNSVPPGAPAWVNLIPLAVLALVLLRNSRARKLKIERLWLAPVLVSLATVLTFANSPVPSTVGIAVDLAAVALGVLLGWWRARASTFTLDPETHEITSRVSIAGILLIAGIFATRYVLRAFLASDASLLHVSAIEVSDSFLLMAVGLVSAQRIEWLIRARRMLAEARAAA